MIEGGWTEGNGWKLVTANSYWVVWLNGNGDETTINLKEYLMNPLAWQAVVKAEGWKPAGEHGMVQKSEIVSFYMHRMIDALCEGKAPEQFLETL